MKYIVIAIQCVTVVDCICPHMHTYTTCFAVLKSSHTTRCDQVIANVGLCLVLHDIASVGVPYIFPGDGAAHIEVSLVAGVVD